MPSTLWLRAETKLQEQRTPLTPEGARRLVEGGIRVVVERSEDRVFPDERYEQAGASLEPAGSWRDAPRDALVLGLKELPDDDRPLPQTHCYFAHAFKAQPAARQILGRFRRGGGVLYDLEYLVDETGRRVAAFGHWAGYVGAALGVGAWTDALRGTSVVGPVAPYPSVDALLAEMQVLLKEAGRLPTAIVTGIRGRSGGGAEQLLEQLGIPLDGWDRDRTEGGGPFEAMLEADLLVHCVGISEPQPPFVDDALLDRKGRRLAAISDVTCDTGSPWNLLPIYEENTSFDEPVASLRESPPLNLVAIDHLPTLLPKESSEDFSTQLLPHLETFFSGSDVWQRARAVFDEKVQPQPGE